MDAAVFFIEAESCQVGRKGETVPGEICIQRRHGNRTIVVLAAGAEEGVRGRITSEVVGSMALHYALDGENTLRGAQTIVRTFVPAEGNPQKGAPDEEKTVASRTVGFMILDIHRSGRVLVTGFGPPCCMLLRGGTEIPFERREVAVEGMEHRRLWRSDFRAVAEDRIVLMTAGVLFSGLLTRRMPQGWRKEGVATYCAEEIAGQPLLSARELAHKIVARAELNDLFAPKRDLTCAVLYLRQPRRILVCSGPPFKEQKDEILADMVARYEGTKLICGGTTAQIVSRELGRSISVVLRRDPAGLPPTSVMEGVDLVTEGVLTLNRVKNLLERTAVDGEVKEKGTDGVVARMLLDHDVVDFVVGTRINPMHQDPNLPVDLELRRNLVKGLGELLEKRYRKEVHIQYI